MDLYLNYLSKRLGECAKRPVDNLFEVALPLKEMLKYGPDNARLLADFASLLASQGFFREAWRLAGKAHAIDPNGRAKDIIAAIEGPPLPQEVTLEVSTVCNLHCPLCENGAGVMDYPRKFMPYETFTQVWDKLAPSTRRLILVGFGETFLHPDIYRILDRVKDTPYIYIDTNANVELDFDRIIDAGIDDFTFSVDGLNQEMYERYRRGGNLERVLRNFRGLVEAKRRRRAAKPAITFKFIVFKHTEMYLKEALELARSLGADKFRVEPCTFRPLFGRELFQRYMPLGPEHQRIEYVDFERGEIGCPPERDSRHCTAAMSGVMVTVEGEVCPCCTANHLLAFGNLTRQGWEEVWHSPGYARFRRRVLADRMSEPVCRVCSREQPSLGRLFEGTEFREEAPPAVSGGKRYYVKDNRVPAQEMNDLVAQGRANEAAYFLAINKADQPAGWQAGRPPAGEAEASESH